MSRYFPSMKKYCWVIVVCLVVSLIAGYGLAKAQPTVYQANATLTVDTSAPDTSLVIGNSGASATDSISKSASYVSEIPTQATMEFISQYDPNIKRRGYGVNDLVVDVTALNPSTTTPLITLTATAVKPADAVMLVNDVAKGFQAYKTQQIQAELTNERKYLQNEYGQYKAQSDALETKILSYSNTSDPHVPLLIADRASIITSMNAVQNQIVALPPTVTSDISILQLASPNGVTSTSKSVEILGVAGAMGLVVGLLIWLLLIFLENRLRGEDQVTEKLGMSYLGALFKNSKIQSGSIPSGGLAARQLADIGANLRLTEVLPGQWNIPQGAVLLVTSTQEAEGKTTIATGLAAAIARSGRTVLVIDGNLRQPTTHLAFGTTPTTFGLGGLLKAAKGTENLDAAVQRSNAPGVWLLGGGTPIDDPSLLLEQKFPGILAQLRKKADCIIIDGPSLLSGAEASLLGAMSDGVALVVDARHDRLKLLLRARDVLRSLTHVPAGVIVNRAARQKRNAYYAARPVSNGAVEAVAVSQQYAGVSNGLNSNNGNGQSSDVTVTAVSPSPPSFPLVPASPGRSSMPMDFTVMQPNPPSPFPTQRRAGMTPPQS